MKSLFFLLPSNKTFSCLITRKLERTGIIILPQRASRSNYKQEFKVHSNKLVTINKLNVFIQYSNCACFIVISITLSFVPQPCKLVLCPKLPLSISLIKFKTSFVIISTISFERP